MLACMGISLLRTADLLERCYAFQLQNQPQQLPGSPAPGTNCVRRRPLEYSKLSTVVVHEEEDEARLQKRMAKVDGLLRSRSKLDRQAAMRILENSSKELGDRSDILWRMAQAFHLASFDEDPQTQKQCSNRALDYAAKALEMNSEDLNCNKWFAITAGKAADISGNTKRKVSVIETLSRHMGKVLEVDPEDPVANHTMGILALRISGMTWCERQILTTGFGIKLPSYTIDEALELFMKAEEKHPNNAKTNRLYVAKCYLVKNDEDAAKTWLAKAKEAHEHHPSDQAAGSEVQTLLRQYGEADKQ